MDESTERIDVRADVGSRPRFGLLGRHVEQGPNGGTLLAAQTSLAEVGQANLIAVVEEHVGGLEITVKDSFAVEVDERLGNVPENTDGVFRG